ncbi:kinase-like domain-containing protein [Nemania sp. FL0031]|nr:kinase-like domain-containing protein [Nemania sp. FL0031]
MANAGGPPQGWWEKWQASSFQFWIYRMSRKPYQEFRRRELEARIPAWAQRPLPYPKPVNRRVDIADVEPMEPEYPSPTAYFPNIDNPPPAGAGRHFYKARDTRDRVLDWFTVVPNVAFVKTLGYGGMGIALRLRKEGASPFDFVVKASLSSAESQDIREEANQLRKMNRAAHCIQTIPNARLGLPEQQRFLFDIPPNDDSSDDGQSSGDDSIYEQSAASRERRTRREIIEQDPNWMRRRTRAHRARIAEAKDLVERRQQEFKGRKRRRRLGWITHRYTGPDTWDENRRDIICLEFCENGDLATLLTKINDDKWLQRDRPNVPNRVLWSFWLCLVRACTAMLFPPRKFHPKRKLGDPRPFNRHPAVDNAGEGKRVGHDLFEEVGRDDSRWWRAKRHVHFDIDPQNILITGIDVMTRDNEHKIIPRLKLADFGLAKVVKPRKRNCYYRNLRHRGKLGHFAPEQFCMDWDYIPLVPGSAAGSEGPEVSEEPIAGNYGPAMNVWQIAIVLWQLMTRMWAPMPPQLQPKIGAHARLPDNFCPLLLDDPAYGYIDIELRRTIARCMAYDPKDRPDVRSLLLQAKTCINKRFAGETDAFIRTWIQEAIYDA